MLKYWIPMFLGSNINCVLYVINKNSTIWTSHRFKYIINYLICNRIRYYCHKRNIFWKALLNSCRASIKPTIVGRVLPWHSGSCYVKWRPMSSQVCIMWDSSGWEIIASILLKFFIITSSRSPYTILLLLASLLVLQVIDFSHEFGITLATKKPFMIIIKMFVHANPGSEFPWTIWTNIRFTFIGNQYAHHCTIYQSIEYVKCERTCNN